MQHPNPISMFGRNADLLAQFAERGVQFVVVGGIAVRYYIPDREADDLDVLINPTEQNAELVIDAVNDGGLRRYDIKASELARRGVQWQIKVDYYADILTPNEDIDFDEVWRTARMASVARQSLPLAVRVAGPSSLVKIIASSQESKHQSDTELLEKLLASGAAR